MRCRLLTMTLAISATLSLSSAHQASATQYFDDNFSTFTDGNLAGQNNWASMFASTTLPVQVTGGKVVIPAAQTADNQDVAKNLLATGVVTPTAEAPADVYIGLHLNMQNAALIKTADNGSPYTSPAYFLALWDSTLDQTNTATHFANYRVLAVQSPTDPTSYLLETRVTGQALSPFQSAVTALHYGQTYNIVVQAHLTTEPQGSSSDFSRIYVNPTAADLSTLTQLVNAPIASGSPAPSVGAVLLSQFASATSGNSGFTLDAARAASTGEEASHWVSGDVNFDGVVNGLDISLISGNWLASGTYLAGDANGDSNNDTGGFVNGLDISTISGNWLGSYTAPPSPGVGVPEPSSIVLASLGLLASLLFVRKRRPTA